MDSHRGHRCRRLTLVDVLQHLALSGKDALIAALKYSGGSLQAARLACRALRDTVDGSLCSVSITPRLLDTERLEAGERVPLHRWPRCSALRIGFADDEPLDEPGAVGELIALPLAGQPSEVLRRITELTLDYAPVVLPPFGLAWLLQRLPSLRRLVLHEEFPEASLPRQAIFDSLACLPHLEELQVASSQALEGVGALAGSLRKLKLVCLEEVTVLDTPVVHGIAQLTALESLDLELYGSAEDVRYLLERLPRSLRSPHLPGCGCLGPRHFNLSAGLLDGRITSLTAAASYKGERLTLSSLTGLAARVLLPSGAVGPHVEQISLRSVLVEADAVLLLAGPDGEALRSLLQRSASVEVGCLAFNHLSPELLEFSGVLLELLRVPKQLELSRAVIDSIKLRLWRAGQPQPRLSQVPAAPADVQVDEQQQERQERQQGQQQQEQEQHLAETAAERLLAVAVRRSGAVVAGSVGTAVTVAGPGQAAAAAAAGGSGHPAAAPAGTAGPEQAAVTPAAVEGSEDAVAVPAGAPAGPGQPAAPQLPNGHAPLLLLRGPLMAGLAWAQPALYGWMLALFMKANPGFLISPGVTAFLALPGNAGVLVQCSDALPAEAVAAAAREAADAASCGGRIQQLSVLPAASDMPDGPTPTFTFAERAFMHAMEQAAQSAWDGQGHFAGWSRGRRLQWLLEEWAKVQSAPLALCLSGATNLPAVDMEAIRTLTRSAEAVLGSLGLSLNAETIRSLGLGL